MKHADVLRQLIPAGAYDQNAPNLNIELAAMGNALDTVMNGGDFLLREMHPPTASVSMIDWERNYGLPDPCVDVSQTIEQRRAALESKVAAIGGQTPAYFLSIAASMGYTGASITEFNLFNCNSNCDKALYADEKWFSCNSSCDDILYIPSALFTWQLNLPPLSIFTMTCDSDCNSSIHSWGDGAIQCRMNKLKPSHTTVIFSYA